MKKITEPKNPEAVQKYQPQINIVVCEHVTEVCYDRWMTNFWPIVYWQYAITPSNSTPLSQLSCK